MFNNLEFIKKELGGIYGEQVVKDMGDIIKLYEYYDGKGQDWEIPDDLDYEPTVKKTNYIKKLIKEEARFLFGKTPQFKIEADSEQAQEDIKAFIDNTLKRNNFDSKLIRGARDCFIGKRVALKLSYSEEFGIKIMFRPSLEFVFEPKDDDIDVLNKIIFFYGLNKEDNAEDQRIWRQSYHMEGERCILNQGVYDGHGDVVSIEHDNEDTGLDFIPAKVIINDGLTGDLSGESDVSEIIANQIAYNKLVSDDIDALKFNMFAQTISTDASAQSLEGMMIAPGAHVDLQTEQTAPDTRQARMEKLEASFSYDSRFESSINRVKSDMFEVLNIPNVSLNELRGMITSGKGMKAIYWPLITRCEEKLQEWGTALEWMVSRMVRMGEVYGVKDVPLDDFNIEILNQFPLMEDEDLEKESDRAEVRDQVRSKKSYMDKWGTTLNGISDEELEQIAKEREMLEDSYSRMEGM